jgi:hypothetical protein
MVRMDACDQCTGILASNETDGESKSEARPTSERLGDKRVIRETEICERCDAPVDLVDGRHDPDAVTQADDAVDRGAKQRLTSASQREQMLRCGPPAQRPEPGAAAAREHDDM